MRESIRTEVSIKHNTANTARVCLEEVFEGGCVAYSEIPLERRGQGEPWTVSMQWIRESCEKRI